MSPEPRVIELFEYNPQEVTRQQLPLEAAELIRREYSNVIKVEATSFLPDSNWKLMVLGVVGYFPLTSQVGLRLLPKVPIENIFRMLEYAYDLQCFNLLKGLIDCSSLEDFYDLLARLLAVQVLSRGRRGFYRDYQKRLEKLPFVRGRLDHRAASQRPWETRIACHFEEHTPDLDENQILAWTLLQILHSGLCTQRSLPLVRQAFRDMAGFVELRPCQPEECIARYYSRLNQDYQPMHALCRFFLEHLGPGHETGDHEMMPFLVKMDRIFELFVVRWLEKHLASGFLIQSQEQVIIDANLDIKFKIDISINDERTGRCVFVMDTKYKSEQPSASDIQQVAAYAETKDCRDAILVYPVSLGQNLSGKVGRINIRSAVFSLDGDLENAGNMFVKDLFGPGAKEDTG
ncbi:MAG: restriction endonuclease [Methanothrix sp.]|nr:restriction endonuclease [Methanothrix sp.]MDD4447953.1 restriction endonuclease [Methanothrix sp.]